MAHDPITDLSEQIKQERVNKQLDELVASLKEVNARLDAIEHVLKETNVAGQTYIK